MTTDGTNDDLRTEGMDGDTDVATLLSRAGPRPRLSVAENARLREAATFAWRAQVRRRRITRYSGLASLAAALTLGIALLWQLPGSRPASSLPGQLIATVQRVSGAPLTAGADTVRTALATGAVLTARHALTLPDGTAVSLALGNGMEMRLLGPMQVTAAAVDDWTIDGGRAYVDSHDAGRSNTIRLRTAHAVIRDIGTRFQVIAEPSRTSVLVRDGRVSMRTASAELPADAGEGLSVDDAGAVTRQAIRPDDPLWDWTFAIAANPDVDGQPVMALLEWVAHETGKRLLFVNADVRRDASERVLRGTLGTLTPLQALDAMLLAVDLDYELTDDGVIIVRHRQSQVSR